MQLGMVGLGKMGSNMGRRLLQGGHVVVVFDRDRERIDETVGYGARRADTLSDLVAELDPPRAVWIMVPAGDPTEETILLLGDLLEAGDTIIDGGNSNYKDSMRRARELQGKAIHFVDVGTSGGIWGLEQGYSLMVGGEDEPVERLRPLLITLAPGPESGWGHVGGNGAGHFVKMVHNGIEYGLMQAYAEGFEIMKAKRGFDLDLHQVAEIWRHGSVVRSWLLDLTANALAEDQDLAGIRGWVADSGEGRWTVAEAIDLEVPAPIITTSLIMRFISRQDESYSARLLAAMRAQFGGHTVKQA
jgi:6-phosphogluconate dehydrogenase